MKILLGALGAVFLLMILPVYAEPYWGNLKVDLESVDRLPGGEGSDVIRVKAKITNNDDEEITIYYMYVLLQDEKRRQFSSSNYYDLEKHGVTERQCPLESSIELNPGLSEDGSFCFEVPEENLKFVLWFYESSPDFCINPTYGSCQQKSVRLNVAAPAPSAPTPPPSSPPITSSPEVVSSSFLQVQINELEQEVTSLESQLSSKNAQLSLKEMDIVTKDQQISDLKAQLADKDDQIAKKDALLMEQLKVISDLASMIQKTIFEPILNYFAIA